MKQSLHHSAERWKTLRRVKLAVGVNLSALEGFLDKSQCWVTVNIQTDENNLKRNAELIQAMSSSLQKGSSGQFCEGGYLSTEIMECVISGYILILRLSVAARGAYKSLSWYQSH